MWGTILGIVDISWGVCVFFYDRSPRLKFAVDYHDNFLSSNVIKKGYRMTPAHRFSIINTGREKIIIDSISFQMDVNRETHYSPISKFPGNRYVLEPKDECTYLVDHVSEEFGNIFEDCEAKKFRVIVEDKTRRKFISKWVKI